MLRILGLIAVFILTLPAGVMFATDVADKIAFPIQVGQNCPYPPPEKSWPRWHNPDAPPLPIGEGQVARSWGDCVWVFLEEDERGVKMFRTPPTRTPVLMAVALGIPTLVTGGVLVLMLRLDHYRYLRAPQKGASTPKA